MVMSGSCTLHTDLVEEFLYQMQGAGSSVASHGHKQLEDSCLGSSLVLQCAATRHWLS
jgi:hypothetical protein